MKMSELSQSVYEFKNDFESAISTASCLDKEYDNGLEAKKALICSQRLIMKIHEVVKLSLTATLKQKRIAHEMHPPLGTTKPELKITGFIKAKQQDVVALIEKYPKSEETIEDGPLKGQVDHIGQEASEKAIVIGIRSQLSSVSKNVDTLMERAFAETLNFRLRLPSLVMGEVYLLPIVEYDNKAMKYNRVLFKTDFTPVERYIKTFLGISGRENSNLDDSMYKYDRSCLLLVDFRDTKPRIFETLDELKSEGIVSNELDVDFGKLSPIGFCTDLVDAYVDRHSV